jgi:glycosyltransferase involved in cell wall biosynthesis
MKDALSVAYLFTTFPVASETFLQREVRAMKALGLNADHYSLWDGEASFEGITIKQLSIWQLSRLPLECIYWFVRRPEVFGSFLRAISYRHPPNRTNSAENFWGLVCALMLARPFLRKRYSGIHAVWGSMPATTAWLIHQFTGIPWSSGAHAYDIFEDGGDWILSEKFRTVAFIHVSTRQAAERLIQLGVSESKIQLIYRGLNALPVIARKHSDSVKKHFISVGRLVPKKGFLHQLNIYAALRDLGYLFTADIIGEGPLRDQLDERIHHLGLQDYVFLRGHLSNEAVFDLLRSADVFLFTGIIAPDGDRDGLPNVIPEAMASGVAVMAAPLPGVSEAVINGKTGWWLPEASAMVRAQFIMNGLADKKDCARIRENARNWVENHFIAAQNSKRLLALFQSHFDA